MKDTPARVFRKKGEQGQALAETALFSVLAIIVIFGIQSPDPVKATHNARVIAQKTLDGDWSATFGASYQVRIYPPSGRGDAGRCEVQWSAPLLFNGLLDISKGSPSVESCFCG